MNFGFFKFGRRDKTRRDEQIVASDEHQQQDADRQERRPRTYSPRTPHGSRPPRAQRSSQDPRAPHGRGYQPPRRDDANQQGPSRHERRPRQHQQEQSSAPRPRPAAPAPRPAPQPLPPQPIVVDTAPVVQRPREDGVSGFYGLGIAPNLLDRIDKLGFHTPTPIQHKAIPLAVEGKDVIGIAQTGTGKTLAFGIPTIQRLAQTRGRALVLAPTRELALQIDEALAPFLQVGGMRCAVVIGGESMGRQIQALQRNPRMIVATPGRLIDLMDQRAARLDDVKVLVLDEADRMLDMGFAPQIERILAQVPRERQTLLFSATMPAEIMKMASTHMSLPVCTEIAPSGTTAEGVTQELFVVRHELKQTLLLKILQQYGGSVLLFARTRRGAHRVSAALRGANVGAAEIHSDRTLAQRKEALAGFKAGKYRVLVATDIASRGIDVRGIELVINYDIPDDPENYVHRIGRTGRAGRKGHAITLATPDQGHDVRAIEQIIRASIQVASHPEVPSDSFSTAAYAKFQALKKHNARKQFGGGSRQPPRGGHGRR